MHLSFLIQIHFNSIVGLVLSLTHVDLLLLGLRLLMLLWLVVNRSMWQIVDRWLLSCHLLHLLSSVRLLNINIRCKFKLRHLYNITLQELVIEQLLWLLLITISEACFISLVAIVGRVVLLGLAWHLLRELGLWGECLSRSRVLVLLQLSTWTFLWWRLWDLLELWWSRHLRTMWGNLWLRIERVMLSVLGLQVLLLMLILLVSLSALKLGPLLVELLLDVLLFLKFIF